MTTPDEYYRSIDELEYAPLPTPPVDTPPNA